MVTQTIDRGTDRHRGVIYLVLLTCLTWSTSAFSLFPNLAPPKWMPPGSKTKTTPTSIADNSKVQEIRNNLFVAVQDPNRKLEVRGLVRDLLIAAESNNYYDPEEALLGDFFVSFVVASDDTDNNQQQEPLWKRLSLTPQASIAGQQYFRDDNELRVVNYSELFGSWVHLRAEGTFAPAATANERASEKSIENRDDDANNELSLFSWPWRRAPTKVDTQKKACPDDYDVTVTKASIHVGGDGDNNNNNRFVWSLPIQGTSVSRILYGDKDLRIFVSPGDTNSAAEWETAGLLVVQVRNDVINPDRPIDLRSNTSS